MVDYNHSSLRNLDEDAALRTIFEGTAAEIGEQFFAALVKNLCRALNVHGAWVTEYLEEVQRLRALAFWLGDQFVPHYEYNIAGTPCEPVIKETRLFCVPERVIELFPEDPDLPDLGAVSYMGTPLLDLDGSILGHLALLDTKPLPEEPRGQIIFQIFTARATAELQRLRAEKEVREREQKLSRLVDSAMDAIIELDQNLKVTQVNAATEKVFRCGAGQILGQDFLQFLSVEGRGKLAYFIRDLDARPEGQRYLWIPEGLRARCLGGEEFPAEATLSRFEMDRQTFYTLILRNVNDRLEAEQKIRALTVEAEYLKEEIKMLQDFGEIIGQSEPILQVLRDVQQVAETDATVLILGETGTGKEVIARAIHHASRRRNKPLIKVNCAAIPTALIESEFFGHEKGAFTGATSKREGRFALADSGTIFLDEIGELSLDLQVKLLRVLQEGEFEPVGSSQTRKVDVRVIAATNRDLQQEVKAGKFREDLYYRLNVFPIKMPRLRERGDDVALLASAFANKFAQKMGRKILPLSPECIRRLQVYDWPGNVRELQNVIERAVITSRDGRLNLDRALPEIASTTANKVTLSTEVDSHRIRTAEELRKLERDNIILALEATDWKVAGKTGAAQLLGMNPSTLASRMKTLGIRRPR
jgi:PAS domain S-box-containing protein